MLMKRVTAAATPCKISEEVNERARERASAVFVGGREGGRTARSISAFSFRNLILGPRLILSQLRLELSVDKKNTREMHVPGAKKVNLIAQKT